MVDNPRADICEQSLMRSLFIKTKGSRWKKLFGVPVALTFLAILFLLINQNFRDTFISTLPQVWQESLISAESHKTVVEQVPLLTMATQPAPAPLDVTPFVRDAALPRPTPEGLGLDAQIPAFLNRWAASWSAKNLVDYFSAYDQQFQPEGRKTILAWKKEREEKILSKSKISVQISDPVIIQTDPKGISVRFNQIYQAEIHGGDKFQSATPKVLIVKQVDNDLKIIREYTP